MSSPDYKGEPPSKDLINGPLKERGCTDIICCLLFVALWVGLIAIAAIGIQKGDPNRLAQGYDPDGNACGQGKVEDYPFIYFAYPIPDGFYNGTNTTTNTTTTTNGTKTNTTTTTTTKPANGTATRQATNTSTTNANGTKTNTTTTTNNTGNGSSTTTTTTTTSSDGMYSQLTTAALTSLKGNLKRVVCVKSCPDGTIPVDCFTNSLVNNCRESKDNKFINYATTPLLGKVCMPNSNNTRIVSYVQQAVSFDEWQSYLSDIRSSYAIVFACAGIALVIGFLYMFIVRCCAGPLVWLSILLFIGSMGALGAFYFQEGQTAAAAADATSDAGAKDKFATDARNNRIFAGIFCGIAGLSLLLTICFCKKIQLAIAVLKAAGRFVQETVSVLFLPPIMFILFFGTFLYFFYMALFIYSAGTQMPPAADDWTPFASYEFDKTLKGMMYFHLFGGLWNLAFNIALTEFILATCCCMWYFKEDGAKICTGIYRAFRYHLGSLAFGSLILAVVWTIRLIFEYVAASIKGNESQNGFVKFMVNCLRCCLDCFERFIRFMNRTAYIQIALTGKNFCRAGEDSFFLVFRNAARFAIIAGLGELFILIGKAFITGLTAFAGYMIITRAPKYKEVISSPYAPTFIFAIIAYFVAANFMSVYGVATEAILQCYLIEEELNAPKKNCPPELRDFLDSKE